MLQQTPNTIRESSLGVPEIMSVFGRALCFPIELRSKISNSTLQETPANGKELFYQTMPSHLGDALVDLTERLNNPYLAPSELSLLSYRAQEILKILAHGEQDGDPIELLARGFWNELSFFLVVESDSPGVIEHNYYYSGTRELIQYLLKLDIDEISELVGCDPWLKQCLPLIKDYLGYPIVHSRNVYGHSREDFIKCCCLIEYKLDKDYVAFLSDNLADFFSTNDQHYLNKFIFPALSASLWIESVGARLKTRINQLLRGATSRQEDNILSFITCSAKHWEGDNDILLILLWLSQSEDITRSKPALKAYQECLWPGYDEVDQIVANAADDPVTVRVMADQREEADRPEATILRLSGEIAQLDPYDDQREKSFQELIGELYRQDYRGLGTRMLPAGFSKNFYIGSFRGYGPHRHSPNEHHKGLMLVRLFGATTIVVPRVRNIYDNRNLDLDLLDVPTAYNYTLGTIYTPINAEYMAQLLAIMASDDHLTKRLRSLTLNIDGDDNIGRLSISPKIFKNLEEFRLTHVASPSSYNWPQVSGLFTPELLKQLKALSVSSNQHLSWGFLDLVGQITAHGSENIERLSLQTYGHTLVDFNNVQSQLCRLKHLKDLTIPLPSENHLSSGAIVNRINLNPELISRLERLRLVGSQEDQTGTLNYFINIIGIEAAKELRSLGISGFNIFQGPEGGDRFFQQLSELSKLHSLSLNHFQVRGLRVSQINDTSRVLSQGETDVTIGLFPWDLLPSSLRILDLSDNTIIDDGELSFISKAPFFAGLQFIDLSATSVTEKSISSIISGIHADQCLSINCRSYHITAQNLIETLIESPPEQVAGIKNIYCTGTRTTTNVQLAQVLKNTPITQHINLIFDDPPARYAGTPLSFA